MTVEMMRCTSDSFCAISTSYKGFEGVLMWNWSYEMKLTDNKAQKKSENLIVFS